jgi:hypothetical protein
VAHRLPSLPSPSASLSNQDLPLVTREAPLLRIHRLECEPAFWGRTGNNRFDAPAGEYGVLYAADKFDGAFIETFGDLSPKTVSVSSLAARGVATVEPNRTLQLVDLAGRGLSRLGLDARICCGDNYVLSQQWSLALWAHPSAPDGIWYASRHDPSERSVALFERSSDAVAVTAAGALMDEAHKTMTARAINKYQFALLRG